MKLIDLLVQELPKRGGWPEGAVCATQDKDGEVCFSEGETPEFGLMAWHDGDWCGNEFHTITATDYDTAIITCAQYESALAASQKPAWNGEGLPPVGCECEYLDNNGRWHPVTIKYASDQLVVISGVTKILGVEQGTEIAKDVIIDKPQFRTLRTEAEIKRNNAAKEMARHANTDEHRKFNAGLRNCLSIYDAIAAGKIPGVKLDD